MPATSRPKKQLGVRKLRNLKALAQSIDDVESAAIRVRGRAAFARHERLRSIVQALKARRLRLGMSLASVARACGIAKPNLSRLENSTRTAPTLDTLQGYAKAVGMSIRIELVAAEAA